MKSSFNKKMHLLAAMLFAAFLVPSIASAVGPAINANVYDGKPATLTITSPQSDSTLGSSPISVEGTVHNISQIMVYIDDTYSMTYPVDNGATTYSFDASVGPGQHILKLIAINPYDGTTVEQQVSFTYTPGQTPLPVEVAQTVAESAQVTGEYLQGQVDQASMTPPATILSDTAYDVMDALDLVPTANGDSVTLVMTRFAAVLGGLTMLFFANPILTSYHFLRYQMLQWNVNALPPLVRHHAAFVLHVVGAISFIGAFFI